MQAFDSRAVRGRVLLCAAATTLCVLTVSATGAQARPVQSRSAAVAPEGDLRTKIHALASQLAVAPIDARDDATWRAVPDLNGVVVDEEATLKNVQNHPNADIQPVFRQVPARVHLDDLGAVPIYRGNPQKPAAALMINVAWGEEYLPAILQTLAAKKVHCTFFLDGSWATRHPELVDRILREGHELGNHGFSHPDMARMGRAAVASQIDRTNAAVEKACGVRPVLFAPPSGSFNQATVEVAHSRKMRTILWTADTVDWKRPPASVVAQRAIRRTQSGGLVLMHPTQPTSTALPSIIDGLRAKGLTLLPVSGVLSPERPAPALGGNPGRDKAQSVKERG